MKKNFMDNWHIKASADFDWPLAKNLPVQKSINIEKKIEPDSYQKRLKMSKSKVWLSKKQ